jgi:hypothetical protein
VIQKVSQLQSEEKQPETDRVSIQEETEDGNPMVEEYDEEEYEQEPESQQTEVVGVGP